MNQADNRAALCDAIKLRAGALKNPLAAHPVAPRLIDDDAHLLRSLAEVCGVSAVRPGLTDPKATFAAGLGSSDFRNVLIDAMRSVTLNRLTAHARHRAFCARRPLRNFKTHTFPSCDVAMNLVETPELAEMIDDIDVAANEGLPAAIRTYGKNLFIRRELVINDDIELISAVFASAGAASARLEAGLVYGLLESNPVLADGELMFHADHGNVVTDGLAGGLSDGLAKLRTMTTPTGQVADLDAAYLLVSPELEWTANKMLRECGMTDINVVASPWLPAGRWYLMADPELQPVVGLLHLKGSQGGLLVGSKQVGKRAMRDGVSLAVRLDVGVVPLGRVGVVRGYV